VEERCLRVDVALIGIGPGRQAACIRHEDVSHASVIYETVRGRIPAAKT
jgi:hypothetical protein